MSPNPGDTIYSPLLESPPPPKRKNTEDSLTMFNGEGVTFSWMGLSVEVMQKSSCWKSSSLVKPKLLVKNSSGMVRSGQMLALMGASGAGKTSLLNALTSRNTDGLQITGRRFVNNCFATKEHLKAVSAYLQQDDLFIGTLTVREHLLFQALCRMDRRISSHEKMERAEVLLDKLGLRKSENTQIGIPGMSKGISGGEKKRLALASELLNNPPLLFCDEPTSGLDSYMAASVMEALSNLAKEGSTVIFTIHQPSSQIFAMFDQLLLISEGRTAYQGNARDASQFFASCGHPCPSDFNPADHIINVLSIPSGKNYECRKAIDAICHQYEKMEKLEDMVISLEKIDAKWGSPYKVSWFTQFKALMGRSWLSVIRNPRLIQANFLQIIIISIVICLIFYNQDINQAGIRNLQGVIFVLLLNQTYITFSASVYVFVGERPILLREHSNGVYRTDVYFITKLLADFPIFIILSLIMTGMVYFIVGLNPDLQSFAMAVIILQLVTHTSLSFTYLISCATNSFVMATTWGISIMNVLMLISGIFNQNGSLPVWIDWMKRFSWILYANEALNINQWANIKHIKCEYNNEVTCIKTGHDVLATLNFNEHNFWNDIVILLTFAVIYRVLAFLALLSKTISKEK